MFLAAEGIEAVFGPRLAHMLSSDDTGMRSLTCNFDGIHMILREHALWIPGVI